MEEDRGTPGWCASQDLLGLPMAEREIRMLERGAPCHREAVRLAIRRRTAGCMQSRRASRASATLGGSPRCPRFQSVMPSTGSGFDRFRPRPLAFALSPGQPDAMPACFTTERLAIIWFLRRKGQVLPFPFSLLPFALVDRSMSFQPARYSGRLMNGSASCAFFARIVL